MANFCLPKDRVDAFIKGLKSGEINPEQLSNLDSASRRDFLSNFVGDSTIAEKVNAEFESKMLLKNKEQGYITWAKHVSGITPETRRDLISRIQRMGNVLDTATEKQFLNDLATRRLGFEVTDKEAQTIAELSKSISELSPKRSTIEQAMQKGFKLSNNDLQYGAYVNELSKFVGDVKNAAEKLQLKDFKNLGVIKKIALKTSGNAKAMLSSLDNSAIGRPGLKVLLTHPNTWRKNAVNSFKYWGKSLGNKNVLDSVKASIYGDPLYEKMLDAKLAVVKAEEAFPEAAIEKVKFVGAPFRASETSYTGFLYKTRADLFKLYLKKAEDMGLNINDKTELQGIGTLVNSLTARGNLGKLESNADTFNKLFFSPRMWKSNLDTLTMHRFLDKNATAFTKKEASKNLVKMIAGVGTVLATADALLPGSVDWDPRSTDYGKIRIGDTRFDVTGGMGSIVTIIARTSSGSAKSSTGKTTDLAGNGYGNNDVIQTIVNYTRNKLSPAAALAINVINRKDQFGNPVTPESAISNTFTPLPIQNIQDSLNDPNSAPLLATIIADGLGVSANTYAPKQQNSWQNTTSKELTAFKNKVGDKKFNEANTKFSNEYNAFISKIKNNGAYQKLSEEEKQTLLNKKQAMLKDDIFKQYGFTYKVEKKNPKRFDNLLNP